MAILEPNSVVPLYAQVRELIRQDIIGGGLKPRQKLPTESEFVARYGVSIITIRRAINELVKEGLVEKKQGKGIFVSAPKYQKTFSNRGMSFSETCAANGIKAGAKVIAADMQIPDRESRELLRLGDNDSVVRILRLRFANDIPCVVEDNYFPAEFSWLLSKDLENDSLYRILREEKGIEIMRGPLTLRIVRADKNTADLLNVARNTPLLRMIGVNYQPNGEVLHTCVQIGYGEDFDFIVR
ncbi:MAG: GntR family transcriptional regulator [Treponema sp.]|jgi:GntR family transcriptional regulator|nr:GntR family transcriptional regulator [Treponema sp.]